MRVSGPAVREITQRLVRTDTALRPRRATRATILDERGEALDQGLAILFNAPHSYTGEDLLELHLHGSPVLAREVVRAALVCVVQHGERQFGAGQIAIFTKQGLLFLLTR